MLKETQSTQESAAATFFEKNKELFEYGKFVGNYLPWVSDQHTNGEANIVNYLQSYNTCQRLQKKHMIDLSEGIINLQFNHRPLLSYASFQLQQLPPPSSAEEIRGSKHFNRNKLLAKYLHDEMQQSDKCNVNSASPVQQLNHNELNATVSEESVLEAADYYLRVVNAPSPLQSETGENKLIEEWKQSESNSIIANRLPLLNELLISEAMRSKVVAHSRVDTATKLELLLGRNCVGRMNANSLKVPNSIKRRIALSNLHCLEQRRQRLFYLLSQDYAKLMSIKNDK